ncbi:MAG: hypothetical protein ABIN36_09985 [Ferruginibacter sp.]
MKTINLHSFNGTNYHDLFIFIMKRPAISYRFIIPRSKNNSACCTHWVNSMEFSCAAYACQLLNEISTDFSYTVPSVYKSKPFDCCIETTEPEKLTEVVYRLLCAYNPNFAAEDDGSFHFGAGQFYRDVFSQGGPHAAAYGLMAVAKDELSIWVRLVTGQE